MKCLIHFFYFIPSSSGCRLFPLVASKFNKPSKHVQKFLFSATLTENPEKIAALELFNPLLFLTQASSRSTVSSNVNGGDETVSGDVAEQDEGRFSSC